MAASPKTALATIVQLCATHYPITAVAKPVVIKTDPRLARWIARQTNIKRMFSVRFTIDRSEREYTRVRCTGPKTIAEICNDLVIEARKQSDQ